MGRSKWLHWTDIPALQARLRSLDSDAYAKPRGVSAVYVLQSDGLTVYVGQSQHLLRRITRHVRHFSFDAAKVRIVESKRDRLLLEKRLIGRLRPECNRLFPRADTLRSDLVRAKSAVC